MEETQYNISYLKQIAVYLFALFSLLSSLVLHFGTMFIMAITLLLLPTISYIMGRRTAGMLECTRELPDFAYIDHPINCIIRITSKKNILGKIEAENILPKWIVNDEKTKSHVDMPDANTMILTTTLTAKKRGVYEIGALNIKIDDPLGFYQFNVTKPSNSKITILPQPYCIPELLNTISGRAGNSQYEGAGSKGGGLDFHSVRPYQFGDELRRVHWPSTAKHGSLNVIEFEHTSIEDTTILLNTQRGTEFGDGMYTTLEYGVGVAAALSEQSLHMGNTAKLIYQGISNEASNYGKGVAHWYYTLDALAKAESNSSIPFSQLLMNQLLLMEQSGSLICISSVIDDDSVTYIDMLQNSGISVWYILMKLPGKISDAEFDYISRLSLAGTATTIVECSQTHLEGKVVYEYPN